jgi:hypothetical protein
VEWSINNTTTINKDDDINKFIKLDDLINNNIIKETIGIIHLDVEGMEHKQYKVVLKQLKNINHIYLLKIILRQDKMKMVKIIV